MYEHLWNDLPDEERKRLMPYEIENEIVKIQQTREMVVQGHKATLRRIDAWITSLQTSLHRRVRDLEAEKNKPTTPNQ